MSETMPTSKSRTKREQRETTIAELIAIAREFFVQHGYANTATEEIVGRAGVTRGALYHHFGNKEGLFKAVLNDVLRENANKIDAAAEANADDWEQLHAGCRAFLQASLDPAFQRIALIDAPAVLGWDTWRALDEANTMRTLSEALSALAEKDMLRPIPLTAITHLLSGAMNEAALWIARADDPPRALNEAVDALEVLLNALRRE